MQNDSGSLRIVWHERRREGSTFQFLPLLQPASASNSAGLNRGCPGWWQRTRSSCLMSPSSSVPLICLQTTDTSRGTWGWRPMMRQGIRFSHGVPLNSCMYSIGLCVQSTQYTLRDQQHSTANSDLIQADLPSVTLEDCWSCWLVMRHVRHFSLDCLSPPACTAKIHLCTRESCQLNVLTTCSQVAPMSACRST